MESKESVQNENMKLLTEIFNLRMILKELYAQSGPNSSDYISFSCKLDFLVKEYMEEKMNMVKNELIENWKQNAIQHHETFVTN